MNASTAKRRKRFIDKIGGEFAKASDQAWLAARSESYRAFTKRFRALEREYLLVYERYPKWALEIRRRVAERIFVESIVRGLPLTVSRRNLRSLDKLGYQDAMRKAEYRIIFVRGALAHGQNRIALRSLTDILPSIQSSVNRRRRSQRRNPLGKELLGLTQSLIVQLLVGEDD